MTPPERLRRIPPARTAPLRGFHPSVGTPDPEAGPTASPRTADEIIAGAVTAAYRVVEENVREGRRTAERLRAAATPDRSDPDTPEPHGGDPHAGESAKALAGRMIGLTRDLGATWVDLIVTVFKDPELRTLLDRITQQPDGRPRPEARSEVRPAAGPFPAAPAAGPAVIQRVSSRRPIEIRLSPMSPWAASEIPVIAGLHGLTAGAPPILSVAFQARPDGALELRLDVPDDQPIGAYVGTVVGRDSLDPLGSLTVRVLE
jgi:hypothetical protein